MREIEDRDGIGDGIGGEKSFLVGGQREGLGIATAKELAGKLGGKRVDQLAGVGVQDIDFVAIGERDEEVGIIARKKQRGGMRTAFESCRGFAQREEPDDRASDEIEFGNGGGIPERNEPALAVRGDYGCVWQRCGDALERGEIEAPDDFAVGRAEQEGFVGTVGSDEEGFDVVANSDAQAGGIGYVSKFVAAEFAARDFRARRKREKSFGRDVAVLKSVDGDSVAGTSLPFSQRIAQRGHGSIQVLAVEAEDQAEEIGLLGLDAQATVGDIANGVCFQIENRERLLPAGSVGAETAVEEDSVTRIGRDRGGCGEIIDAARIAREFAEDFAVGNLRGRLRGGILREQRKHKQKEADARLR